jgi:SNF2 family DNA or RNA helicase
MQIVEDKALVVQTKYPNTITSQIKNSAVVEQNGDVYDVAVKWGLKEARALATIMGSAVPSPIKRDYKWTGKLTPFAHQKETASFLTIYDKAFCFNQQGTGKTASVIWAADYLMKLGLIKRVLVLCPLSIMKSAWQQDLFKFAMHRSCSVAHGDAKARKKILTAKSEFVIMNFDGLAVVKDEVMAAAFDLIVVDEANAYKNSQTRRWKVLRDVSAVVPRLWMLTGTPAAQSPTDAYGLAKLVNPDGVPKFFGSFRDQVMMKITQFKWAPKNNARDIVHHALQPAIRFERDQCLDLPPVTHVERDAPLTPQQNKYYNVLRQEMLLEAAGESVTAVNAAVKLNKLLQISSGAVYSDAGAVIEFDVSNRLNVVLEVIEEASNKVLVFVPFNHTIELLQNRLTRDGISCDVINGKVNPNRRADIVQEFQTRTDPHVLIIQPQAASHGLTLTAADTIIWYAPVTSVETYLQANARINRPGQKHPMTIVHIQGSPVEARLYKMLETNIDNHQQVIDLYRQELTPTP